MRPVLHRSRCIDRREEPVISTSSLSGDSHRRIPRLAASIGRCPSFGSRSAACLAHRRGRQRLPDGSPHVGPARARGPARRAGGPRLRRGAGAHRDGRPGGPGGGTAAAAARLRGHDPGLSDAGPRLFRGDPGHRRPDGARHEPRGLRRDGGRQPRVRLRPGAAGEVAVGGEVSLALGQHRGKGRQAGLFPVPGQDSQRRSCRHPRPDDEEHPVLGAPVPHCRLEVLWTRSRRRSVRSRSCAARRSATSSSSSRTRASSATSRRARRDGTAGENQAYAIATEVPGSTSS